MGGRLAFVFCLCTLAAPAIVAQNPALVQHEIMLKLLLQNQELDLTSLDSLTLVIYKTNADSAELEALHKSMVDIARSLGLAVPLHALLRNSFKRNGNENVRPQAVFLLNSPTITLRQLGRAWHRLGVLTFTNLPDQMDDGIAIAVSQDSVGQQKILMNPRALERASASFSTEILQLTATRYARGSGL